MFKLSSEAFLIPANLNIIDTGGSMTHITGKYKISEDNRIKIQYALKNSIIYGDDIKRQNLIFITGLMVILDLFKLHNIFVDDDMNLDTSIKQIDFKTSDIINNMFKYIISSVSSIDANNTSTATMTLSTATTTKKDIGLKCTIARLFHNKKKMLFSIFLIIIGVNNYEKKGYMFKTGGNTYNSTNFANKLYKLMHEFFFGPIPSHSSNSNILKNAHNKIGRPKKDRYKKNAGSKRRLAEEHAFTAYNRNYDIDAPTNIVTRGSKRIKMDYPYDLSDIFKYDSAIYDITFLQDGSDLIIPSDIFDV